MFNLKGFKILIFLLVVSSSISATNYTNKGKTIYFDLTIAEDATPAVLKKILMLDKQGVSEIKFEKGTYHFYPDKGYESFKYISNHCDLMVSTPFPIEDFKNLTIDGQGAEFIFHGVMIPFLIERSENITLKNVTIDWFESGNVTNVVIRNNTFQDCQHGGKDRGVIRFATDEDNDNMAFRNIEIRDNVFNHFDNLILEVTNADGLVFSGNTITNSGTYPMLNKQNPAIEIKNPKHIKFKNNSYQGNAEKIIQSDSSMSKLNFQ